MNTAIIEAKKSVTFNIFFVNTRSSKQSIYNYIPFTPDEFIIRTVMYYPLAGADEHTLNISQLYADFLQDNTIPLCSFYSVTNGCVYCPDVSFFVKKPMSDTLTFNSINTITNTDETLRSGVLVVQGEFVKYNDLKQPKIY